MRVFEFQLKSIGEKEWICAYTYIEAIKIYMENNDYSTEELNIEDDIVEVEKSKWSETMIEDPDFNENDEDNIKEISLEEYMKDAGIPHTIAVTIGLI